MNAPTPLTSKDLDALEFVALTAAEHLPGEWRIHVDEKEPPSDVAFLDNRLGRRFDPPIILRLVATTRAAQADSDKAERIAAEAYQVIGSLADAAGFFATPEVTRALDYFSSDAMDGSILPFTPPTDGDADKLVSERHVLALRSIVQEVAKAIRELRLADGACGRQADGCDVRWDRALHRACELEPLIKAALRPTRLGSEVQ